ncbi:MAG: hypothetical protein WKF71_10550 [Pyrinomonadaceae bacterium]
MNKKVRIPFVVDEQPYCLWDREVSAKNLDLLNRIDPDYFNYLAVVNYNLLKNNETEKKVKQHAAISLRTSYSHGLEAFFALIGAAIQAPDCVLGWLLKYQNSDLLKIVKKINSHEFLYTNIQNSPISWKIVSDFIFSPFSASEDEHLKLNIEKFSDIWSYFADDFTNQNFIDEYNAIKHGFRVQIGGFFVAIDNIKSGNEFGSSYFQQEKIDKHNFLIHEQSRNWQPENYYHALHLISDSIRNIITFLKGFNGSDTNDLKYVFLKDLDLFSKPWEKGIGLSDMKSHSTIPIDKIPLLTEEQILIRYDSKFPI